MTLICVHPLDWLRRILVSRSRGRLTTWRLVAFGREFLFFLSPSRQVIIVFQSRHSALIRIIFYLSFTNLSTLLLDIIFDVESASLNEPNNDWKRISFKKGWQSCKKRQFIRMADWDIMILLSIGQTALLSTIAELAVTVALALSLMQNTNLHYTFYTFHHNSLTRRRLIYESLRDFKVTYVQTWARVHTFRCLL